jgi:phosphoenolpyruvate-protein phosphotransferase (PTS system enzyme I)
MKGTGVVGGMAYAPLFVIRDEEAQVSKLAAGSADVETGRFDRARQEASAQIQSLIQNAEANGNAECAEIFDYQLLMLEDDDFTGEIKAMMRSQGVSAEYALHAVGEGIKKQLLELDNDYLKGRTADIDDLTGRLHNALSGRESFDPSNIASPHIVAARDLTPSQTASFKPASVKGIATEGGGGGSHSVIIARSLGIPCIVGAQGLMEIAADGMPAFMDADAGTIELNPTETQAAAFMTYEKEKAEKQSVLSEYIHRKARTKDGHEIGIYANIASAGEAALAVQNGCDGVGLFRTEFLYMEGGVPPGYDTQLRTYSGIAKKLDGKPLIIRTLDAGGDKNIPYLNIGRESNPFLGYRAIRYCLGNRELFKTQLAAIVAASACPGVEMMLPMIATMSELRQARELIEEVKQSYAEKSGVKPPAMRVGMMVETPSAAFDADRFAGEVDFFSIGTNDLAQYFFAADRGNEKVAYLNSCFHPSLLRLVKHICDCGRKQGINVDICGHAGEEPLLVPLFVAMGIDNLSVSIPSILSTRRIVCRLDKASLLPVLEEALSLDEAREVEVFLRNQFSDILS